MTVPSGTASGHSTTKRPGPRGRVGASPRWSSLVKRLVLVYAGVWGLLAISPVDRQTWLLENLLVFALITLLALSHGRFAFSRLSCALIFAFLLLHSVGAHYTYSAVPLGDWLQHALALERNHYDRLVHLAFGLLLGYPVRELVLRQMHVHRIWSFVVPVLVILALSSSYEIAEWCAARLVDPAVGIAYVGAQGDAWDGQKDMTLVLVGSILAMVVTAFLRRLWGHEPYLERGC